MAISSPTYTIGDLVTIAGKVISRNIEDDHAAYIATSGMNLIWRRYDWREAITALPPFYLIPNEQDHGAPAVSVPSNFWGLRKAWLMRTSTTPPVRWAIRILNALDETHMRYVPHAIAYNAATESFRMFPRVPENIGAPDYMVSGEYKISAPKYVASTLASTYSPFQDHYFPVVLEAFRWAAMNFAGDPRMGEISRQNGQEFTTGQLARAMAAIDEMARTENLESGDMNISPAEPLVAGGRYPASSWGLGIFNL